MRLEGIRTIEPRKLKQYLLDVMHPVGGSKARFFVQHGFSPDEPETFETALLEHANVRDVEEIAERTYGRNHVVVCNISTPDGRNPCVKVVWSSQPGSRAKRLVTAYPAK
jgi:hypothetical protein